MSSFTVTTASTLVRPTTFSEELVAKTSISVGSTRVKKNLPLKGEGVDVASCETVPDWPSDDVVGAVVVGETVAGTEVGLVAGDVAVGIAGVSVGGPDGVTKTVAVGSSLEESELEHPIISTKTKITATSGSPFDLRNHFGSSFKFGLASICRSSRKRSGCG